MLLLTSADSPLSLPEVSKAESAKE
jgi:hypothetical protein